MEESLSKLLGSAITGAVEQKSRMTKQMLDLAAADHGLASGTLKLQQVAETGAVIIVPLDATQSGSLKNYGSVGSVYWQELESRVKSEPDEPQLGPHKNDGPAP